jgi:hypothetical protein
MSCLIIMSLPSNCDCPSRIAKSLTIEIDLLNSCRTVRRADLAGIGSGNWGFSRVDLALVLNRSGFGAASFYEKDGDYGRAIPGPAA